MTIMSVFGVPRSLRILRNSFYHKGMTLAAPAPWFFSKAALSGPQQAANAAFAAAGHSTAGITRNQRVKIMGSALRGLLHGGKPHMKYGRSLSPQEISGAIAAARAAASSARAPAVLPTPTAVGVGYF
jgi:hypothetical protein